MTTQDYLAHMRASYDNTSHAAYAVHGGKFADEYVLAYATSADGLRELADVLQSRISHRRVLEVACGHGRWTRYVARVASYLLATDNSPRMLARAAQLVHHNNILPPGRVELREWDAMKLPDLPEMFDAAFHVNFFDHLPRSLQQVFLDGLHSRLSSGSPVVMALNKLSDSTRQQLFSHPGSDDMFLRRQRPDGSTYDIIDNEMGEVELIAMVGSRGTGFSFRHGKRHSWLAYAAA